MRKRVIDLTPEELETAAREAFTEAARRAELVRRAFDIAKHGGGVVYGGPNLFNWCLDNGIPCILQEPIPVDPKARIFVRVFK